MHVVHVDRQRSWTGQTLRVYFVAKTLREHGHTATLVVHPGSAMALAAKRDGLPCIEAPMRGPLFHLSAWRVARALRGSEVDILHCHGGRDRKLARRLQRSLGVRHLVRTKHNHTPPRSDRSLADYESCARIVTVSKYVRDVLVEGGVTADRIQVIPDAVDLDRFQPRPREPELARSLGIAPDDLVVGNVSSLHARKGIEDVLRAHARLVQGPFAPRLKCLLVGKQYAQWVPLARELGIEDSVLFPGYRKDVPEMLSLLDVYVLMSRREALGTSVLEAMAMERPVVVSDVGGLAESVTNDTGVRCTPGDVEGVAKAVAELLERPEERRRMGRGGRQRVVAHYDRRQLADDTLALYEALLAHEPRGRGDRHFAAGEIGVGNTPARSLP